MNDSQKSNTVSNAQAGNNSIVLVIQGDVNGTIQPIYDAKRERRERKRTANIKSTKNKEALTEPYTGSEAELEEQLENISNCD